MDCPAPTTAFPSRRGRPAGVGDTPLLRIGKPFTGSPGGFWAKLEGFNPGGVKDRAALRLVACARERGDLRPGAPIVESASGARALALALAGAVHGHPVHLVTGSAPDPATGRLLGAYGAIVHRVDGPRSPGGGERARRTRVAGLLAELPGAWCPDRYRHPGLATAYAPLAAELAGRLERIDVLVCAVGTGGHATGIARALRLSMPGLRLAGVDSIGSAVFGQPARLRLMRGLGSSVRPDGFDHAAFDEVHWVAPGEAVRTARRLAELRYATGGWSVGAVALAAGWLARTEPPGTRIAAVFPDGPHRYADTVFSDAHCRAHGLLDRTPPSRPETIGTPGEREAVRWTRWVR
ncbi:pyridoxal-phosphate dependent enzyme [Streptomyces sp. CAU 1734]|uniref:PLP-dependent cysteine synthase family protein n=1 Tax=Streptomyces sp. CAU 1734 TaxID=3140360 RepID=UPI003260D56C